MNFDWNNITLFKIKKHSCFFTNFVRCTSDSKIYKKQIYFILTVQIFNSTSMVLN